MADTEFHPCAFVSVVSSFPGGLFMNTVVKGTWVEIERVLLKPEERAANLPPETAKVPYILKVSGFLTGDSELGQEATVRTLIGHEYRGLLKIVNPSYAHSFGATVPELLHIGIGGQA